MLGGILTLVILQLRTGLLPMVFYRVPWIAQLQDSRTGVPYGAAMAPAALIVFPDTGLGGARGLLRLCAGRESLAPSAVLLTIAQRARSESCRKSAEILVINHPLTFPRETARY